MDDNTYDTNIEQSSFKEKQQYIKKGRLLHDQAIGQMIILIVRNLSHPFKKDFSRSHGNAKAYEV